VSEPNDPSEREADRVADQVMRMKDNAAVIESKAPAIQRKCAKCEDEVQEKFLARRESGAVTDIALDTTAAVRVAEQSGTPLSPELRYHFEPRFGQDFSSVRVHTGDEAAKGAQSVQARAFTLGRNIVFGAGEYSPTTTEGHHLLAHELAHVIQQEHAAPATMVQRKMHNKTILEPTRKDAKACLVHLHGEEHTAAAVAKELYGRRCVNYVHLDTDQGPLTGLNQRFVEFDVDVKSVNFTCRADPNRVFSDKGRRNDATDAGAKCKPTNPAQNIAGITKKDIVDASADELKKFVDADWGAGISKCREGAGTGDLSGPLPVLALHNNEAGDTPATAILSKYAGQVDPKDPRTKSDPNPVFTADPGNPSDVFLVTDPNDFNAVKGSVNVAIQAKPVPPAGEDGSLSVALQNERFINVEKKGRDHAGLVPIGPGFKGHDSVYVKNYAMAVKALEVLGVPEGPCVPPPAPTTPAQWVHEITHFTALSNQTKSPQAAATTPPAPFPHEAVDPKNVSAGCKIFDASTIVDRKTFWQKQISTLPVLDVVNWIVGAWDLSGTLPLAMPKVVREAVTEAFAQRQCLLTAMTKGVKAQGGTVPAGNLIASGARSFQGQATIWEDKWNFKGSREFDRISANAAAKSGGLLKAGDKWKTSDPIHKLMWGVVQPTNTKDPAVAKFLGAKATPLTAVEREMEILEASSAPGVSRHHAGTDFDIGQKGTKQDELDPKLWQPGEKYFDLGRWLFHNAATWGFMRPFETKGGYGKGYMSEDWHWSYWPIAQALLEFARRNRSDMESELQAHWGAAGKAKPQFPFIWKAWFDFLNNVDEKPRF
jgi:hypothetical protein